MAELVFSREDGTMYLVDGDGNVVDSWDAANNTTIPDGDPCTVGSNGPAPNGEWPIGRIADTGDSRRYGPHFIQVGDSGESGTERNDIARQRGIGIHGGREGEPDSHGRTGHEHNTQGCIRMENDDLEELVDWMGDHADDDAVESITIQDESFNQNEGGLDGSGSEEGEPPLPPDDGGGSVPNPGDGGCD